MKRGCHEHEVRLFEQLFSFFRVVNAGFKTDNFYFAISIFNVDRPKLVLSISYGDLLLSSFEGGFLNWV